MEQSWHRVPGGTATAALAVARAMAAGPDAPEQVGVAARHRHPAPAELTPPMRVRHLPLPRLALYEAWSRTSLPPVEWVTGSVDVIHGTTIIPPAGRAPIVMTVHDLAFLHEPTHFTSHGQRLFRRSLERIRRRAAVVLCSSTATMDDCAAAGLSSERLRLVPLGVSPTAPLPAETVVTALARLGVRGPYVLFVGTQEPRKNLPRLVQAFDEACRAGGLPTDAELVLAGPEGWGDALPAGPGNGTARHADTGSRAAMTGRWRALGRVSDADLAALYAGALVTCQPSLREGFGLPVLEAMAHGSPVVTSRGTATEEVAGGAAVLVDPVDSTDIARGLAEAVGRRRELVAAGLARARVLTWVATAERTLTAYREVAR